MSSGLWTLHSSDAVFLPSGWLLVPRHTSSVIGLRCQLPTTARDALYSLVRDDVSLLLDKAR